MEMNSIIGPSGKLLCSNHTEIFLDDIMTVTESNLGPTQGLNPFAPGANISWSVTSPLLPMVRMIFCLNKIFY